MEYNNATDGRTLQTPGGESFVRGLRWLGPDSPLRECAVLAALAAAKIPRRRTYAISKHALKMKRRLTGDI
jgi:hypothetical protein